MNSKTKKAALAASGIIAITLLCALTHADSLRHSDSLALNTTIDEATEVALGSVSGTLIGVELEMDDGQAVWELEVVNVALTAYREMVWRYDPQGQGRVGPKTLSATVL